MKTIYLLICLSTTFMVNSQSIDYNIKKGFAIDGYDVISYFKNEVKQGNEIYIGEYDGVKYKFSSQNNLDAFNLAPEKYIPQYGGYCAYAVGLKSKKVSINPKTYEIRNDKLYLFYNSWGINTLKLWLKESPEELIQKADINWKTIK